MTEAEEFQLDTLNRVKITDPDVVETAADDLKASGMNRPDNRLNVFMRVNGPGVRKSDNLMHLFYDAFLANGKQITVCRKHPAQKILPLSPNYRKVRHDIKAAD